MTSSIQGTYFFNQNHFVLVSKRRDSGKILWSKFKTCDPFTTFDSSTMTMAGCPNRAMKKGPLVV